MFNIKYKINIHDIIEHLNVELGPMIDVCFSSSMALICGNSNVLKGVLFKLALTHPFLRHHL